MGPSGMRFHNYINTTGYEILHCVDDDGWEILSELNHKPAADSWKPIRVERVRGSLREGFRASDSPYRGSHCLVFRRSAVDALRDMLDTHGELLPLEDKDGVELWLFHPRSIDALDQEKTQGSRLPDGRIELPRIHVFIPEKVKGVDIFKLVAARAGGIYLSERFLQRWKQAKLKGLDFYLIWDSELPPDQQPNKYTSKPVKL
jgi:hypothetical protein